MVWFCPIATTQQGVVFQKSKPPTPPSQIHSQRGHGDMHPPKNIYPPWKLSHSHQYLVWLWACPPFPSSAMGITNLRFKIAESMLMLLFVFCLEIISILQISFMPIPKVMNVPSAKVNPLAVQMRPAGCHFKTGLIWWFCSMLFL